MEEENNTGPSTKPPDTQPDPSAPDTTVTPPTFHLVTEGAKPPNLEKRGYDKAAESEGSRKFEE